MKRVKEGATMKRVDVHEFRNHTWEYLAGDETLAVERDGQPIGLYIPTGQNKREKLAQALERLEETVQRLVAETGLSEEELSRLFDIKQPLPEDLNRQGSSIPSVAHASGR